MVNSNNVQVFGHVTKTWMVVGFPFHFFINIILNLKSFLTLNSHCSFLAICISKKSGFLN